MRRISRLVARGFTQEKGMDDNATFSPVNKMETIRTLLDLSQHFYLQMRQFDFKTAYLNDTLKEEIFMHQPDGFVVADQEQKVCKLVKSLYGLKQAGREWNSCFTKFLTKFKCQS